MSFAWQKKDQATMLTRHFYDLHSVEETLFHVAGNFKDPLRKQKLVFWTYELILSEEEERMWGVLTRIAHRYGNSALLAASSPPSDPLHFLQLFLSLPYPYEPPKDIEDAGVAELATFIPERPTTWSAFQRSRLFTAVQDALAHRRTLRLARLLGGLPPSTAALYLGCPSQGVLHMLETLGLPPLPTHSVPLKWPTLPVGRLAARLFSVPRTLLPAPIGPSGAEVAQGCAFWRRVWQDDMWDTYFPDDIPDEWSTAEKAKSHAL